MVMEANKHDKNYMYENTDNQTPGFQIFQEKQEKHIVI